MDRSKAADDGPKRSRKRGRNNNDMPPPPPVEASGPLRSVEGWVLFVTGIHEEAQEEDIREVFCDYGRIKSIVINSDRQSGLAKGYALVEFSERNEAQDAINALHGKKMLGKTIGVHWAFCNQQLDREIQR